MTSKIKSLDSSHCDNNANGDVVNVSVHQRPWNSKQSLTTGLATFLDGISRTVMLPFGPTLVHRLIQSQPETTTAASPTTIIKLTLHDCGKVPLPYALVVSAYILGRALGWRCFRNLYLPPERLPRIAARIAGMVISLYVFTLGSGLQSVGWLVGIRFLAATLVGTLCAITREKEIHGAEISSRNRSSSEDLRNQEEGFVDTLKDGRCQESKANPKSAGKMSSLASIKIYLTASAVSILAGGLLYRHVTGDVTFQALTQTNQLSLSPAFLVAVAVAAESSIRCFFHYVGCDDNQHQQRYSLISQKSSSGSLVDWTPSPDSPAKSRKRLQSTGSDVFVSPRERLGSVSSRRSVLDTSEFFDCNSVLSDMDDMPLFDDGDVETGGSLIVAQYQDRKVVYADGTPAHVPAGDSPDVVPANYLQICGGKQNKAETMWRATQQWRREQKLWKIHRTPNKWFPQIKQAYPHFVHGFSKDGYPIIYEQPGKMNLKQLFRSGCNVSDMVRHYMFLLEYISNHVCTRDEIRSKKGFRPPPHSSSTWGIMVVMDVKGAGLSHLSGDVLLYLKSAGDVNSAHYPLSLKRAFAINSPFWLAGAWSGIKGIMPDSVTVDLLSSHQYLRALRERIDDDQIPPEYGGSSPYHLGEHPFEKALYDLVEQAGSTCDDGEDDDIDTTIETKPSQTSILRESRTPSSQLLSEQPGESRTLRHRAASETLVSFNLDTLDNDDKKTAAVSGEGKILMTVSYMHSSFMIIQGMLETAIPLWLLVPPDLGGLGYAPSRSGVALFSSSIVLLWVIGTFLKKFLPRDPYTKPMRSFRIGTGTAAIVLGLLVAVSKMASGDERTNSVLVMAMTIITVSCLVLAGIFGRASSMVLHFIAASNFAADDHHDLSFWLGSLYGGSEKLKSDCMTGIFTSKLSYTSQILGAVLSGLISAWSLGEQRHTPFDGTLCFCVAALLSVALYISSFFLHINSGGGFSTYQRDKACGSDSRSRRCLSFMYEIISVSVSDMASLFDESNWRTSPLLGRHGPEVV
jgi:hypothetical protein